MTGVTQSQGYSLLPTCFLTNPLSKWFSKKPDDLELQLLILKETSTPSVSLTARDVVKMDIAQLFKDLLKANNNVLEESNRMTIKRACLSYITAGVIGVISIPPAIGTAYVIYSWSMNFNDYETLGILLAGLMFGIPLAVCCEMSVFMIVIMLLIFKGKKESQIGRCMEQMSKVKIQDFNRFMDEEMQGFPSIAMQMQEFVKTDPNTFLQILNQIYELFILWKSTENYGKIINDYNSLKSELNSSNKSAIFKEKVISFVIDETRFNFRQAKQLREKIEAGKRSLENMLRKLSEEDSIV